MIWTDKVLLDSDLKTYRRLRGQMDAAQDFSVEPLEFEVAASLAESWFIFMADIRDRYDVDPESSIYISPVTGYIFFTEEDYDS